MTHLEIAFWIALFFGMGYGVHAAIIFGLRKRAEGKPLTHHVKKIVHRLKGRISKGEMK